MLEAKKNNIHLCFNRTPLVGDVVVGVSFKTKANSCCFNKLKGSCVCACFPKGSEDACLVYALFLHVRRALCGDAMAMSKSKVSLVDCVVHNGQFSLSWHVRGVGSAVRKSLGIALRQLNPAKLFSTYSRCVREANGKLSRESFNYVADEAIKAINDKLHCVVVGNIKLKKKDANGKEIDAHDLGAMLDVLANKLQVAPVPRDQKKQNPADGKEHVDCSHEDWTEVKSAGWQTAVIRDYIAFREPSLNPLVCDRYLLLLIKPTQWKTKSDKMKSLVKDYVARRYVKIGDDVSQILAYSMLSSASASAADAYDAIRTKVSAQAVEKALRETF